MSKQQQQLATLLPNLPPEIHLFIFSFLPVFPYYFSLKSLNKYMAEGLNHMLRTATSLNLSPLARNPHDNYSMRNHLRKFLPEVGDNLTHLVLPSGIDLGLEFVFESCPKLKEITIPFASPFGARWGWMPRDDTQLTKEFTKDSSLSSNLKVLNIIYQTHRARKVYRRDTTISSDEVGLILGKFPKLSKLNLYNVQLESEELLSKTQQIIEIKRSILDNILNRKYTAARQLIQDTSMSYQVLRDYASNMEENFSLNVYDGVLGSVRKELFRLMDLGITLNCYAITRSVSRRQTQYETYHQFLLHYGKWSTKEKILNELRSRGYDFMHYLTSNDWVSVFAASIPHARHFWNYLFNTWAKRDILNTFLRSDIVQAVYNTEFLDEMVRRGIKLKNVPNILVTTINNSQVFDWLCSHGCHFSQDTDFRTLAIEHMSRAKVLAKLIEDGKHAVFEKHESNDEQNINRAELNQASQSSSISDSDSSSSSSESDSSSSDSESDSDDDRSGDSVSDSDGGSLHEKPTTDITVSKEKEATSTDNSNVFSSSSDPSSNNNSQSDSNSSSSSDLESDSSSDSDSDSDSSSSSSESDSSSSDSESGLKRGNNSNQIEIGGNYASHLKGIDMLLLLIQHSSVPDYIIALALKYVDSGHIKTFRSATGDSYLHIALRKPRAEIARLLLTRYGGIDDINAKNKTGETALHLACAHPHDMLGIIELILDTHPETEISLKTQDGLYPVEICLKVIQSHSLSQSLFADILSRLQIDELEIQNWVKLNDEKNLAKDHLFKQRREKKTITGKRGRPRTTSDDVPEEGDDSVTNQKRFKYTRDVDSCPDEDSDLNEAVVGRMSLRRTVRKYSS